ncbi:MAG: transporter substrate-binding domain-containing protein [Spirochaetaceae bacterium]|nr:transporter substrate-binding domain-containing protein [Spirochaetaceae bacterium]
MKKRFLVIGAVVVCAGILFASCSKNNDKKIQVAYTQAYAPYDFVNDKGEADGFEVAVLKEVNKLIDSYEFQFVATSDEDLLIGVESGKYAVGIKGAWVTDERRKKYIIPNENIAVSIIGIVYRTADSDKIKDIETFAKFSGKLVPISPQSAQYSLMEEYNKEHPDAELKLVPYESFVNNDAYTWVVEGRYDAYLDLKVLFQGTIVSKSGAWHDYLDKLMYAPYKAIPTYPVFNKERQDLADKYDAAIKTLRENGTLTKLSNKYFDEDIFSY